jgi:hypothetical protein
MQFIVLIVFPEGQVQPFWLDTTDGEKLFCWHVLPLDVYLQNEDQLVMSTRTGEVVDELKGTAGEKLLRNDPEARVVINFHGVSIFSSLDLSVTVPSQFFCLHAFFLQHLFDLFSRITFYADRWSHTHSDAN